MKKYSIIALFVALVVSLSSCNDDFMQRNPIDDMADGTFFTKEADLQLYLDGIYRYYVYGHGHGGTNSTTHDKGFLAVKAGSQIIFGDALVTILFMQAILMVSWEVLMTLRIRLPRILTHPGSGKTS